MSKKPTYDELFKQVKELKKIISDSNKAPKGVLSNPGYLVKLNNSLSDAIFTVKLPERIIEYTNTSVERIFGYTPEECVGKTTEFLYQNSSDYVLLGKKLQKTVNKNKDSLSTEQTFVKKNGETFPSEVTISFIRDKGEITHVISIVRDITERKESREALIESERRHKTIIETTIDGFWVTDIDLNLLQVNDAYCKMSGYSEEELLSMRVSDLEDNESKKLNERTQEIIEKGFLRFESKHRRKDGTLFDVEVSIQPHSGKKHTFFSFTRDITERKKAELALSESEEKYRSMMESMDDGVYICSADFRIEYMNPSMIRIIGRDATGELCHNAIFCRSTKCPVCVHENVMKGESTRTETKIQDKDRVFTVSHSPIFHVDGTVSKIAIYRDITEIKKIEEKLQQAQKMEGIGTLAGGIAHDFNNILSPIMMHAELAMGDLPPEDPLQHSMNEIFRAGCRARDLTQQILTFARQRSEERILLKSSLIIKEAIQFLRSTIPSTVDIRYDISARKDTIHADPTQVNQIIMNLCTNAAYAMKETGGILEITIDNEDITAHKADSAVTLSPGQYLKISVRDSGTGISPDIIDRIFEPYYTTKKIGEGTGLGLATVHGIVKNYGGDIKIESKIGRGTTFHVYLPLVDIEIPNNDMQRTENPKGNERILIVDDEKAALDVMKSILEKLGYQVTTKTNSIEGLKAFRNRPDAFDLVITDMTMPNMTGVDLAKEILAVTPEMPIILCTGFSDIIDEKKAIEIGISSFVMKPIVVSEIAKTIRRILDKKC